MTIKFDKKIYGLRTIKSAISAYEGLADFRVLSQKDSFVVDLKNIDEDVKDIISDEFGNYVLHEFIVDYKNEKN